MRDFLVQPDWAGRVREMEPLARWTRYRLGGPARWLVRPGSVRQLCALRVSCREQDTVFYPLGGGANLLVHDDGVDGVVVRLDSAEFTAIDWPAAAHGGSAEDPVIIRAGAGVDMARLTLQAVKRGLSGLEGMAGIPGSLGGIIRMNAGGKWGQISDVVRDVTVVDCDGRLQTLNREEVGFSYRRTRLNGSIVCAVTLLLQPDDPVEVRRRYDAIWNEKNQCQPLAAHSAGCVFKNPPGDSAGRLIDQAGLKGRRCRTAYVSPEHANFLVAETGGRAGDVLELIEVVRREVALRHGVELELEIKVWDRQPALTV